MAGAGLDSHLPERLKRLSSLHLRSFFARRLVHSRVGIADWRLSYACRISVLLEISNGICRFQAISWRHQSGTGGHSYRHSDTGSPCSATFVTRIPVPVLRSDLALIV